MERINRQWLLARRPDGRITPENFSYREAKFPEPNLRPGELLVRAQAFAIPPVMRAWMKTTIQFVPPMPVGEVVQGSCAAEVIASNNQDWPVGSVLSAFIGWQDYAVIDPSRLLVPPRRKPAWMSLVEFDGLYGGNSMTAYFGVLRVGELKRGETVLVSGAAGSTGSMAAQIAKAQGCRVIGIAGGADKCAWLLKEAKVDAAIDYKSEDLDARLGELVPDGLNLFFDNVGGEILNTAIEHMAPFGRITLCGQISSYNDGNATAPGPRNMMRLIYWRLKMQGFLMNDFWDQQDAAVSELRRWAAEGRLVHYTTMRRGFKALPATFMEMFEGSHIGTLMVETD